MNGYIKFGDEPVPEEIANLFCAAATIGGLILSVGVTQIDKILDEGIIDLNNEQHKILFAQLFYKALDDGADTDEYNRRYFGVRDLLLKYYTNRDKSELRNEPERVEGRG